MKSEEKVLDYTDFYACIVLLGFAYLIFISAGHPTFIFGSLTLVWFQRCFIKIPAVKNFYFFLIAEYSLGQILFYHRWILGVGVIWSCLILDTYLKKLDEPAKN
jgi:hypothetical protein